MKNIIDRLQKDLSKLQDTLQKEGNNLLKKMKRTEILDNIETRTKNFEKVVEIQLKKFEPAFQKFMKQLNKNAQRAGINLEQLEQDFLKSARTHAANLKKKAKSATTRLQKTVGKKTAKKKKKAPPKTNAAPKRAKTQRRAKSDTTES